jgi:hypothetical protein
MKKMSMLMSKTRLDAGGPAVALKREDENCEATSMAARVRMCSGWWIKYFWNATRFVA